METKINKWDLIKLKSFFTPKEALSTIKIFSDLEKVIANVSTDK